MKNNNRPFREDILIVDDTPDNLRLLSQMLSDHGFEVRAVTSCAHALESIQLNLPDLILLDIKMPEMTGYQLCERLKSDEQTRDIPVIFISALDDIQDKVTAFEVGGVDYITKPFQIEEVLARTQTHLALRKLQEQLQNSNKRFERELDLASKMQASFLPGELPSIPGWGLSATLKPASEMSGDFFDVFQLPNGSLGILIADVVDHGVSAALFMVLSWSLLRTYAAEYVTQPELVFQAVDRRITLDTDTTQFVTAFYGILDPRSGELVYSNAGHNPPLLINHHEEIQLKELKIPGSALGILENPSWERKLVKLTAGDILVLYTDGITEAQNPQDDFFGVKGLKMSIQEKISLTANQIQNGILTDVNKFVAGNPINDDIALVVIKRQVQES